MFNLKENNAENHVMISWYLDELRNDLIIESPHNKKYYTNEDEESMIKSIFETEIVPDNIIVIKEENQYRLLDGEKRLVSINDFVDGKITYNGHHYNDLSQEMRNVFLGCYLTIKIA